MRPAAADAHAVAGDKEVRKDRGALGLWQLPHGLLPLRGDDSLVSACLRDTRLQWQAAAQAQAAKKPATTATSSGIYSRHMDFFR